MIYFVDDDVNQMRPFRDELEFRGYTVKSLRHSDEALQCLRQASDVELVILDVMLGTGPKESSEFSREETRDFLITGLALINKLMTESHDKFKNKVVIFSMASQSIVLDEISKSIDEHGVTYLRKTNYADPEEFGNKVIGQLK